MEKSAYTAAPAATPTWGTRVRGGSAVAPAQPPQPRDLQLKSARQAQGFFATFPRKLKETFEYARDHPGQFALSVATSMVTYVVLRGAIAMALGFTPCLAASVAIAMITSATISIGRSLVDHLYGPPPDQNELGEAHQTTFRGVMGKALETSLWSGAIAGLTGVFFGNFLDKFRIEYNAKIEEVYHAQQAVGHEYVAHYAQTHPGSTPLPEGLPLEAKYIDDYKGFGYRTHPVTGLWKMHNGLDFPAPEGTPVFSTGEGIVREIEYGYGHGYGNHVIVETPDHSLHMYAHLSRVSVTEGTPIHMGEQLGNVGHSGLSSGNHLHYEVRVSPDGNPIPDTPGKCDITKGTPINPALLLPPLATVRGR